MFLQAAVMATQLSQTPELTGASGAVLVAEGSSAAEGCSKHASTQHHDESNPCQFNAFWYTMSFANAGQGLPLPEQPVLCNPVRSTNVA